MKYIFFKRCPKCIGMHTAYTAGWHKVTLTVNRSTQTHLELLNLNDWKLVDLKKLVFQTCVCICLNLCCHLRDVTFVTHVLPSRIKTISVKFNHNSAGIREGGSRIFWAFIACWELQMKASLRYPTLNYFEQNDAFIKMLSILDVNT